MSDVPRVTFHGTETLLRILGFRFQMLALAAYVPNEVFHILRQYYQTSAGTERFFLVVQAPAAEPTDAPQPSGLLCNPVMKRFIFFPVFPYNGVPVE